MPPLQLVGQLRWNTQYALDYENTFPSAQKRWILNRIWNDTEFRAIYSTLLSRGVHHRDMLLRCFDFDEYERIETEQDRLMYLTSQNEGRNAGIMDGRDSGFEWSMILDGNTFISNDSWTTLQRNFQNASQHGMYYVKIPYHRLHVEQTPATINLKTTMQGMLHLAPVKGESQIAFHKYAPELFTLGDTKPTEENEKKRRGYGQRNKSYMFKEGQICGHDSDICKCAEVPEGNEEQFFSKGVNHTYNLGGTEAYLNECGLVVRLWNFPPENVIYTGLSSKNETGFFCYYLHSDIRSSLIASVFTGPGRHYYSECMVLNKAVEVWRDMGTAQRQPYVQKWDSRQCKDEYHLTFLNSSCFRAEDRAIAQSFAYENINKALQQKQQQKQKQPQQPQQKSTCLQLLMERKVKRQSMQPHHLLTLSDPQLEFERQAYRKVANKTRVNGKVVFLPTFKPQLNKLGLGVLGGTGGSTGLVEYVSTMVAMADRSLQLEHTYSVIRKKKTPPNTLDKHYYYSVSPHVWPVEEVPENLKKKLEEQFLAGKGIISTDDKARRMWKQGYYLNVDQRLPGSSIGEADSDNYDRSSAWYLVDNVTTLALAWYFTNDTRYSDFGARLVRTWFLNNQTSMVPSLHYAGRGGVLDWKDFYFFLDSVTLLERSGSMAQWTEHVLEAWTARLAEWITSSQDGRAEAASPNHRGMYFDLTVLALSRHSFEEDMQDGARTRLMYRLSEPYPRGHFALDGGQPWETEQRSPGQGKKASASASGLHFACFNLLGWIHAGLAVDAISANSVIPGVIPSLFAVRHAPYAKKITDILGLSPQASRVAEYLKKGASAANWVAAEGAAGGDGKSLPVILKAIRYLAQFLPDDNEAARAYSTTSFPGEAHFKNKDKDMNSLLGIKFPFRQDEPFNFDRLLEIVQLGVGIYGASNVFPSLGGAVPDAVGKWSPYSTARASFGRYSSVLDPSSSGQRSWGALGRPKPPPSPKAPNNSTRPRP